MLSASLVMLVALMQSAATAPQPNDEWRPYTANPAYEVFGHEDSAGVFRFTLQRKAMPALPTVNYGVHLPSPTAAPAAPVSGTDLKAGRELLEHTALRPSGAAARPCPDGRRCPRPEPPPSIPHPLKDLASLPHIGLMVVAAVVIGFGFLVICLLVLALVIWSRKD